MMELFAASFLFVSLLLHVSADETTSVKKTRIVGGVNADPGEYPFFGKVYERGFVITKKLSKVHLIFIAVQWGGCGASLVWKDVLLSAAHVSHCRVSLPFNKLSLTLMSYIPSATYSGLMTSCVVLTSPKPSKGIQSTP